MPRGGRRRGAGRPTGTSVLDWYETMVVAGECQRRWREDYALRLAAEEAAYFNRSTYAEDAAAVRRTGGKDPEALEDVEFSRREMAQMDPDDDAEAPRVISFRVARPYGVKRKILTEVAAWASGEFGKPVTPGLVSAAWSILKRIEAESV